MNSVDPGISSPRQSSRKRQRTSTADELQPLTAATAVGLSRNSNPSRSNSNSRSASPFVRASNSNTNSKEKEKEVDSDATVDDPITQIINQIPIGQGQDGGEGEASTSYSTRSDNKTGASNPSTPRLLKKGNRTLEEADRSRSGSPGGKRAAGTGRGGKLKGSPGRKPKDQANGGLVIRIESPKEKEKGKGKNEGKDKLKEVQLGEMEKEIQRESQTQKDDVDVEMQLDPNSFEDSVRETEKEKEREPETIEVEKEVVEIEESPEELEKELELKNQREEGQKIKAAKDKEMEETLLQGWKEEFFEIVEQLPLELQRSFALMRELEQQMHSRLESISNTSKAYRNARIVLEGGEPQEEETTTLTEMKDSNNLNSSSEGRVQIEGQNEKEIEIDGQPESGGISVSTSQVLEEESMDVEMSSLLPSSSTTSQDKESASRNLAQEKVTPTPNPSTHNPENSASTGIQSRAARRALLKHIADSSTEAIRSAEEKIGLAATAYDWVDRHIRRLDSDLLKSESNLSLGLRPGTEQSNVVRDSISVSGNGKGKGKNPSEMGLDVNRNGSGAEGNSLEIDFNGEGVENGIEGNKKKIRRHAPKNHRIEMEEFSVLPDMPIDPNEPRYCYCDQVSFGDMVACENDDCPREWFHYHCVDLLSQPKGKWWCQFCAPKGWRGLGASIPPGAPFVPPGMRRS